MAARKGRRLPTILRSWQGFILTTSVSTGRDPETSNHRVTLPLHRFPTPNQKAAAPLLTAIRSYSRTLRAIPNTAISAATVTYLTLKQMTKGTEASPPRQTDAEPKAQSSHPGGDR